MAILDKKLEFFDAQALAGNSGATFAGNTIDLGPAKNALGTAINPNTGRGEPIYLHVRIGTAVAGNPATGTVALYLQHATADSPASFSNLVNLNLNGASSMTQNLLTAGKLVYSAPLPVNCKRYLRVKATLAGATCSAGTVDAWIEGGSLPKSFE
jgi:hypothetical protein